MGPFNDTYGARSAENRHFLDGLLRHHAKVARGTTISVDQTVKQSIPCTAIKFSLPLGCQSNGVTTIPVIVPTAWLGTTILAHDDIFYALIEEIIVWLAGVGPKHTLMRLYHDNHNHGQRLPQLFRGERPHSDFESFISNLRQSQNHLPDLDEASGALGVMEVTQARTPSHQVSADFIVTLTLNNRERILSSYPVASGNCRSIGCWTGWRCSTDSHLEFDGSTYHPGYYLKDVYRPYIIIRLSSGNLLPCPFFSRWGGNS